MVRGDVDMRIEIAQPNFGRGNFWPADVAGAVQYLSLQIAEFDDVGIHDSQVPDACRSEVERCGGTQATRSDEKDARSLEPTLTFLADIGKDQVAVVALQFVRREISLFVQRHPVSWCGSRI
jgi:hypothetical protein